jgi:hypothetical protein
MAGIQTPDPRLGAKGFVPIVQPMLAEVELVKSGIHFQKHYDCSKCHKSYREDEMVFYQGKPYGKPCSCYKDIKSLMNKGRK